MPIPSICWLAALVALLALEAATVGLVSLWFAVGSLCALLTSFFVSNIWVQFAVFLAVSFLCLVIIRPLARKYADPRRESTNHPGYNIEKSRKAGGLPNKARQSLPAFFFYFTSPSSNLSPHSGQNFGG